MIFWIVASMMLAGGVAAVARPLLKPRQGPGRRGAFDRAVYRDQLAELQREVERGVVDAEAAQTVRLEIERRLLASEDGEGGAADAAAPVGAVGVASLAIALCAGAVTLYLAIGSPDLRDQPFAARQSARAAAASAEESPDALAARLDALTRRVAEHPEDAEGWLLLARGQVGLQRWPDAAAAYQRAMALTGNAPAATSGYAEMLVLSAGGIVTPAARAAFADALAKDPGNFGARFYLALGDAQAGKPGDALAAWQKLAADSPADAPWLPELRRRMAEAASAAGGATDAKAASANAADAGAAGPSAADLQRAAAMSADERRRMIRGMVDGLARRLEANPDDPAGWQRLADAYRVLGETAKAAQAASRLAALRPDTVAGLLAQARAMLPDGAGEPDVQAPLPPEFVAVMKRVAERDPRQPEALWYLGLAAAQQHDPAAALDYWRRLLAVLDPDSEQYKTVEAAIGALTPNSN